MDIGDRWFSIIKPDSVIQKINLSPLSTISSSHSSDEEVRDLSHVVPEPIESISLEDINSLPARLNPAVLREKRVSEGIA